MTRHDLSRRNALRTGALGVGALGSMSMVSAAATTSAGAAPAVADAVDIFLKIDGVPGDSRDSKHKDEIDVLSFSWGVGRKSGLLGGPPVGKPTLQDFDFVMPVSKASPLLMVGSAKGTHFKKALLTVRTAGDQQLEFYKVTMEDCLVSSYQTSASSDVPSEQISLDFAKVTFSYQPQRPDGTPDPPIIVTYP